MGAFDPNALASKLQSTKDDIDEEEASKCSRFKLTIIIEKKAFRAKMKSHYAGEFNAAAAMKQKPKWDADEDDQWALISNRMWIEACHYLLLINFDRHNNFKE